MNRKHGKTELILRYFHGSKRYFACAVAASFATTALNAVTPQIFRFSIDQVLGGDGYPHLKENLWLLSLAIVAVAVLSGIFLFITRACTAQAGENFAKNMRDALFFHVQRLPMSWHDQNQTGDIIQRCTSDVEVIRNFVVTQLLEVFRTVFLVGISFAAMVSMNRKLAFVVLLFVPVVVLYSAVFYRLIAKRFTKADEAEGELSTVVQENATGVRVVRAFGREQFEMERFREKNEAFARMWIRLGTLSGLYWGVGDLITGLQVTAVVVLGAMEAVHGNMTVGDFVAFASYNTVLVWPVRGLGRILSDMSKAGVSFERVDYIIHGQEEAYGDAGIVQEHGRKRVSGEMTAGTDIMFSHVSFAYEQGEKVLDDVSFTIPQGKTFGILGGTGSGKSTIVQLLTRLYEPEEGTITIGGTDIRELPLPWLRRKVGMVLQEPFLYSRTIRENIAASAPESSMEEIRQAARTACVDDAVMGFADGYETLVGERGVTLSGGQRQRVAIARMLLQKAPIMVFDDSLSAVDNRTDYQIRQALKEQMEGATVILISHRITTLMGADQILVLDRGRVKETGTHAELIRQDGIYRQIYDMQMRVDDREDEGEAVQMAAYEEQEYNRPFSFRIWAKMFPFFKPYKKYFMTTLGLNIFLASVDILVPLFQSYAIDHFIMENTLDGIRIFTLVYVLMITAQTVSVYFSVHAATTIEMNIGRDLKRVQFEHLQTLSFSYYNTTPVGYIHARVMSDTLRIATMVAWGLVDMFWAFIYVVTVFGVMFFLNAGLALIITLVVPGIALLTVCFQNKILHWNRKVRRINSQITSAYNEGITGVKTSKSMVIEKDNDREFFSQTAQMHQASSRSAKLNAVYIPVILFFGSVVSAIVLTKGGGMVQTGRMQLGTLSVFISYAVVIFEPIQQLARLLSELISCQANIERVMDLLEQEPNVVDREDVVERYGDAFTARREHWERIRGDIVFEDVSFRYPDGKEYVLEHFNLHVPAGMNVAIVGETGAGKSTLVNLLGRFFEPTEGRILIDGVDYRERSQLWLHSQMGYVLQNPHLFSGTIRENIRYGRLDAADAEVEEAARQVSADLVAARLEHGYESNVGESGGRLSVGEKQLISFARAVLADPAIFVLDEATSSIDTKTEQLIRQATGHLLKGRTSFMIAHRLSTVRQADLILVIKDGKIMEQGTHQELLAMGGYYQELYLRQFEEEAAMQVFAGE